MPRFEHPDPTAPAAHRTGIRGEELAARYLLREGFDLRHRNWRQGRYELDLVAEREGVLHIVEVKTRGAGSLTSPEEAMTPAKFEALRRAALFYMKYHRLDMDVQFDLVAIEIDPSGEYDIRYLPDVMSSPW